MYTLQLLFPRAEKFYDRHCRCDEYVRTVWSNALFDDLARQAFNAGCMVPPAPGKLMSAGRYRASIGAVIQSLFWRLVPAHGRRLKSIAECFVKLM
jgi:hypothetical protein